MRAALTVAALVAALALPTSAAAMHLGKQRPEGAARPVEIDSVLVVGDRLEVGTAPISSGSRGWT